LSCTCCKNFVRFLSGFWMVKLKRN
jgi:hypothetical protein